MLDFGLLNYETFHKYSEYGSLACFMYRLIRECYKYYAGMSPCGIIPGIGINAFNEIINATSI